MTRTKNTILALIAVLLSPMANAEPITITWTGSFNNGVSFDGTDVSGLSWVVRQTGDTAFADIEASTAIGRFLGFTTELDIIGVAGLSGMVADNTSGFEMTATVMSLVNDPITNCFLCGFNIVNPIDPNSLSGFSSVNINNNLGFFGFASFNGPLNSFNGGRTFDSNYSNNPLTSVAATVAAVAVPEPGTLALLGIGLFSMGFMRRRRA